MCLLITAPAGAGADLEDDWLEDFHWWNSDGYGFMFAQDGKLHIHRSLGKKEEFIADWRKYANVERAVHLRMRTHGDVDLVNCHPYEVIPGKIALMHNGVLHTGNDADKSKSDTWHFIQDYLRPLLTRDPELMLEPAFQELVAEFIGTTNRLVLLDNNGNMVTINEDEGVYWEGMWLSNEYAWSSPNNKWHSRNTLIYDDQEYDQYDKDYKAFKERLTRDVKNDREEDHNLDAEDEKESINELASSITEALMWLDKQYYKEASNLNRDYFVTFAVQRGDNALWDAVEELIDGGIDEQQFCRLIKNGTLYAPDEADVLNERYSS